MRKTSVYLTDEQAEGLRRISAAQGRAQAELIREAIRHVIDRAESQSRTFRSLGAGRGGGRPFERWTSSEAYAKVPREG